METLATRAEVNQFFSAADAVLSVFERRLARVCSAGPLTDEQQANLVLMMQITDQLRSMFKAQAERV